MPATPVQEGDILAGKYKIERVLAKGGMGLVVAAMHEQLDQRVALKFLLPDGASDSNAIGRFLREARAAVRLRSEHVAKVLDVGTLDTGSPYIVMEYLDGRDLQAVLAERGRLPSTTAVSHVLQACEAIAEAHAQGIVHRDLKPANLFLTRRNDGSACIKVLDFGISKLTGGIDGLTKASVVMGSPYYMSPQQMRSSREADPRCDIWALGMILYELLTGVVAFPRETLPELCASIIYDPIPHPTTHGVELAPGLVEIITRCLEKEPELRYRNLAELGRALAPFTPNGDRSAERIQRILDPALRSRSSRPAADLTVAAKTQVSASQLPLAAGAPDTSLETDGPPLSKVGPTNSATLADDEPIDFEPLLDQAPRKPAWLVPLSITLVTAAVVLSTFLIFGRGMSAPVAKSALTPSSATVNHTAEPAIDTTLDEPTVIPSVVREGIADTVAKAAATTEAAPVRRRGSIPIDPALHSAPPDSGDFGPRK